MEHRLQPLRANLEAADIWHARCNARATLQTRSDVARDVQTAPARLIESALELARAESTLVLVQVRDVAVRAVGALLATIVGAAFAQVAIVLAVISPLLRETMSLLNVIVAVAVPALFALASGSVALRAWRGILRAASQEPRADEVVPLKAASLT
jgi:hypothetical protein